MPWYVDTSAFVKLVIEERHAKAFRRWAERDDQRLFTSDLLRTEACHAARRLSPTALREMKHRLDVLDIITIPTSTYERAAELDPSILRSLDALHLAAAMTIGDELEGIATYDARLAEAAALHGVDVIAPT